MNKLIIKKMYVFINRMTRPSRDVAVVFFLGILAIHVATISAKYIG